MQERGRTTRMTYYRCIILVVSTISSPHRTCTYELLSPPYSIGESDNKHVGLLSIVITLWGRLESNQRIFVFTTNALPVILYYDIVSNSCY